jgi:hypothetical protein
VEGGYAKVALDQAIAMNWQGKPVFIRHRTPAVRPGGKVKSG